MGDKVAPRIPSGFPEYLPAEQMAFNEMLEKIRRTYALYGYAPIETPAIELSEVLLAKAGGETEKQIYQFTKGDNDLCLHFDLTVPLARYVAQHYGDLTFPFKRQQTQKVWRAERPQSGRFREFYQCDIDVIGSRDPIVDAEIPAVIHATFKALGFESFTIRINNRKILNGFFAGLGLQEKSVDILRVIDKINKIGELAVKEELCVMDVDSNVSDKIISFIGITGTNTEVLRELDEVGVDHDLYQEGVRELKAVIDAIGSFGVPERNYRVDLSIARGLDYYTGTVYETILDDYSQIGSVCSGGRFDNLAQYYTDQDLPGVGVSIGLTRLFYSLKELGLVKVGKSTPTEVLVASMGSNFMKNCLEIATSLREKGICTDVAVSQGKFGKVIKYADKLGIPYVIIVGEKEVEENKISLKEMATGNQALLSLSEVVNLITKTS